ncbi:MAG: DUF4124 domain-containing protein [Burkholderiaceae bacterium]
MKSSSSSVRWPLAAGMALSVMIALMAPASAQYQWRDDEGQMVYSDKPPPPSIKPSQIIRAQPMAAPAPRPVSAPAPDAARDADRQMEERRRAEEAARKEKETTERAARTAIACEHLRAEQRTLESGMRIATILPNGEREYMSDETRDRRTTEVRKNLSELCAG